MSDFANDGKQGARIYLLRPGVDAFGGVGNDAGKDMNARRNKRATRARNRAKSSLPFAEQELPDFHLVTALLDMQEQLGDIRASLQVLSKSGEETRTMVKELAARVDDLVAWKNKVIGGAVVAGVVATFLLALLGTGAKLLYDATRKPPIQLSHPLGTFVVGVVKVGFSLEIYDV